MNWTDEPNRLKAEIERIAARLEKAVAAIKTLNRRLKAVEALKGREGGRK